MNGQSWGNCIFRCCDVSRVTSVINRELETYKCNEATNFDDY